MARYLRDQVFAPGISPLSVLLYKQEYLLCMEMASNAIFRRDAVRHYPLLAGVDPRGPKVYLCLTKNSFIGTVEEGRTAATVVSGYEGSIRREKDFGLLVTRYDPPIDSTRRWPASRDAAGHLCWRKISAKEKLLVKRADPYSSYWRIITRRCGEFVERARDSLSTETLEYAAWYESTKFAHRSNCPWYQSDRFSKVIARTPG